MRRLFNFNFEEELFVEVDKVIADSKGKFRDRTQFVWLAIQEKLHKEISEKSVTQHVV